MDEMADLLHESMKILGIYIWLLSNPLLRASYVIPGTNQYSLK